MVCELCDMLLTAAPKKARLRGNGHFNHHTYRDSSIMLIMSLQISTSSLSILAL
jgi:hypothetical protein